VVEEDWFSCGHRHKLNETNGKPPHDPLVRYLMNLDQVGGNAVRTRDTLQDWQQSSYLKEGVDLLFLMHASKR
jgi:hypothetical protein